jgi:hypothetical protein
MFIATSVREKLSLRRSETWKRNDCHGKQKRLRSYGAPEKEGPPAINISLLWSEEANNPLLHF